MSNMQDEVALITGASSGIGRARDEASHITGTTLTPDEGFTRTI